MFSEQERGHSWQGDPAGASALGQGEVQNGRCLIWPERPAEMCREPAFHFQIWAQPHIWEDAHVACCPGQPAQWYFSITLNREVQPLVDSNVTIQGENN